jgi:hypothetical protein
MGPVECKQCKKLFRETSEAIRVHLRAITQACEAVSRPAGEFDFYHRAVLEARSAEAEAFTRYQNHVASHSGGVAQGDETVLPRSVQEERVSSASAGAFAGTNDGQS